MFVPPEPPFSPPDRSTILAALLVSLLAIR
jgi:hypothetical protein